MKNGKCIKCNSATVYTAQLGVFYGDLKLEGAGFPGIIGSPLYISYLCTTCGYFENYVDDQQMLQKVSSNKGWKKVG